MCSCFGCPVILSPLLHTSILILFYSITVSGWWIVHCVHLYCGTFFFFPSCVLKPCLGNCCNSSIGNNCLSVFSYKGRKSMEIFSYMYILRFVKMGRITDVWFSEKVENLWMENSICRSNWRLLLVLITGSMFLSGFAFLFNQNRNERIWMYKSCNVTETCFGCIGAVRIRDLKSLWGSTLPNAVLTCIVTLTQNS